jgi:hypothetical protein
VKVKFTTTQIVSVCDRDAITLISLERIVSRMQSATILVKVTVSLLAPFRQDILVYSIRGHQIYFQIDRFPFYKIVQIQL